VNLSANVLSKASTRGSATLFPIGQRRLPAPKLVVLGCVPEQKVKPVEHAASDDDKAGKKQQRL
jgi:hypothetical protein